MHVDLKRFGDELAHDAHEVEAGLLPIFTGALEVESDSGDHGNSGLRSLPSQPHPDGPIFKVLPILHGGRDCTRQEQRG